MNSRINSPKDKLNDRLTISGRDVTTQLGELAEAVRSGLTASPKSIPSRFFYDEKGSLLFEEISKLHEYYLTRSEKEILQENSQHIASHFPDPINMAELGSGSASKTRHLIEAFIETHGKLCYIPVDISRSILEKSSLDLVKDYENIEILALAYEYVEGLQRISKLNNRRKLILWLGSNIGNLERGEAVSFLRRVRTTMGINDRFLIGIDLRKDRSTLERAYNDIKGVTAEFNKNLLTQINRELGGNFDLNAFQHQVQYDEKSGAVQMYLVSLKDQKIAIQGLDLEIAFESGETIHTENSFKYSLEEIESLASESGYVIDAQWKDQEGSFSENLLKPV